MGWVSLATAIFSFSKELFKYMREHEENNRKCATKIKDVKDAIKHARETKDTSKLENAFGKLTLGNK